MDSSLVESQKKRLREQVSFWVADGSWITTRQTSRHVTGKTRLFGDGCQLNGNS